jgi:hypothetical protein
MGDAKAGPVRLSCNPQLRVECRGATVTSDAGLLCGPASWTSGAAWAIPALYEALERRGVASAICRPARAVLERAIETLLVRPRGPPSHAPLVRSRSVQDQAASWDRPRRVIVTTLTGTNRAVVHCYNGRGTAEQWIKKGKEAPY